MSIPTSKQPHDSSETVQRDAVQTDRPHDRLAANVGIRWRGKDCIFTDWRYLPQINLARDYLPTTIRQKVTGASVGDCIVHGFKPGELIEDVSPRRVLTLKPGPFQRAMEIAGYARPALGRFYPRTVLGDSPVLYKKNQLPLRVTALTPERVQVDLNHPLAGKAIELLVDIRSISTADGKGGARQDHDIPALICDTGPGMQDELSDGRSDFLTPDAFSRIDESDDHTAFQPSLAPFWDHTALRQVSRLYDALIPNNANLLDLMAGVHTPLQESARRPASLVAVGLNRVELDANPLCTERHVLNVNTIDRLPFASGRFDVVLNHAAIEYVTRPQRLFEEIHRVLAPGGRAIITFSNRYVDDKAIRLWTSAEEFERVGIVLAYLRSSGGFTNFNACSQRGLPRPADDELADQYRYSDPIFTVCADKA